MKREKWSDQEWTRRVQTEDPEEETQTDANTPKTETAPHHFLGLSFPIGEMWGVDCMLLKTPCKTYAHVQN